jgi:hypothetical protein
MVFFGVLADFLGCFEVDFLGGGLRGLEVLDFGWFWSFFVELF